MGLHAGHHVLLDSMGTAQPIRVIIATQIVRNVQDEGIISALLAQAAGF